MIGKKICLLGIVVFVFCLVAMMWSMILSNDDPVALGEISGKNSSYVSAVYSDYAESFSELEDTSALVVKGLVISADQNSVAQQAEIEVFKIFKGEASRDIAVNQIISDNPVEVGKEYIFFLAPQYPETMNSNVYYPVGGGQGVLEVNEAELILVANSSHIIDDALDRWLSEHVDLETNSEFYSLSEGTRYTVILRNAEC